jgi:hypothetical protein
MELILRDLGIQGLKQHLNKCRDYCESLARNFEKAQTSLERANLAFTWDAALKHGQMVQLLLELLERCEREGRTVGTQRIR